MGTAPGEPDNSAALGDERRLSMSKDDSGRRSGGSLMR